MEYIVDDDDDVPDDQFALGPADTAGAAHLATFVRSRLPTMSPLQVRAAAVLVLALERLPQTTPGLNISLVFSERNIGGNYAWADLQMSEDEISLQTGEHVYSADVGGDTASQTLLWLRAGSYSRDGDSDAWEEWVEMAGLFAANGKVTLEDCSELDESIWS